MTGQVEINLVGEFGIMKPIGASIRYGINMIPIATISLGVEHLALLCDFEQYRRTEASLLIKTTSGCLYFDGLVDGLSFTQGDRSIGAELVLKSKFQHLMELYPRMPGFHPSTISVFNRIAALKINTSSPNNILSQIDITRNLSFDADTTIVDLFVRAVEASLKAQQDVVLRSAAGQDLADLIEVSKAFADEKIPRGLELIKQIDTTATSKMAVRASSWLVVDAVLKHLENSTGNLLEDLMLKLAHYGCAMVIGNEKAFIIPESGFLKIPHDDVLPKQASDKVNIIYPSQFDSFQFSDGGHVDLKALYVVSDANVNITNERLQGDLGKYIDQDGKGGLQTMSLPDFVSLGLSYTLAKNNETVRDKVASGTTTVQGQMDPDTVASQYDENYRKKQVESNQLRSQFLDNWAQMKYLQNKFTDRAGQIHSTFSPKWAPGAVGTLYTRHPGTYLDFFVHSVSHSFSVSAPNSGTATTTIGFNCGRVGNATESTGVDKILLYDYTYTDARTFSEAFVKDITT